MIWGEPSLFKITIDAIFLLTYAATHQHVYLNWFTRPTQAETTNMTEPVVAQKSPYGVEVEAGKSYFWCACGKSANQPFCDGSHADTEFTPVKFEAQESKQLFFCGCKATSNQPLCDGTHNGL